MAQLAAKLKEWGEKAAALMPKPRWHSGPLVGIDTGHHATKAIRIAPAGSAYDVQDAFLVNQDAGETEVTERLATRGYLKQNAAFSLADESVETHSFRLPKLPNDELDTAIQWELKKTIASPDFVFHDVLKHQAPNGVDVECVVVAKDVVNSLYEVGRRYGLTPAYLETESSALLSCVRTLRKGDPNRLVVVDLGHSSFRLVFLHHGRVSLTRSLYFGLGSLVNEGDPAPTGEERGVKEGLYNLGEEFRRSEYFAKDKKGLDEIEEILLCGGGATLEPAVAYLREHLSDKKVSVLNPFASLTKPPEGVLPAAGPAWAVAFGLAVREGA